MSTLNELSQDLITLEWQLDHADTDEQRTALVAAYLEAEGEAKVKIDNYASLIGELEARAEIRKRESARLANRAKQDEGTATFLRSRLLAYFDCHHVTTLETARYRVTAGSVGGKRPLLISVEPEQLPAEYRQEQILVKPETEAIRADLEAGVVIDGCCLGERKRTIKIS